MAQFLIVTQSISDRLDESLENAHIPAISRPILKDFIRAVGSKLWAGNPVQFQIYELCQLAKRCDKTIRIWLNRLHEAGILIKKRVGRGGLILQLAKPFLYSKTKRSSPTSPRLEEAIEERLLELGSRVENPEGLRRSLREKMTESEIDATLRRRAERLTKKALPVVDEVASKPVKEELPEESEIREDESKNAQATVSKKQIFEAAKHRVEEKKSAENFAGFTQGEQSYLHGTRRNLERDPEQVLEILERKKAAEKKKAREEARRKAEREKLLKAQEKALAEEARHRELLADFKKSQQEKRRALIEKAEKKLPANIRQLQFSHPTRVEMLERKIVDELTREEADKRPGRRLEERRDLSAELYERLSRRRL